HTYRTRRPNGSPSDSRRQCPSVAPRWSELAGTPVTAAAEATRRRRSRPIRKRHRPALRPSPKRTTAEPLRRGSHREGVGTYETLRDTRIHDRNPSNRPPGDGRRDSGPAGWTRSVELGVREARVRRVSALVRIRMSKRLGMIRRPPGVPQAEAGEP